MGKLELLVNVSSVFYGPIVLAALVNTGSVCPKLSTRLDFLEEKAIGLQPSRAGLIDKIIGQFPAAYLFAHNEAPVTEIDLIKLDNVLQYMVFLR
jgi:hypothetical protein